VDQLAAGTYVPGQPLVSVRCSGLLRLPFIGPAVGRFLEPALEALKEHISTEGIDHGVVRVSEHVADAWPVTSRMLPHPPGRGLYAPAPDEVPPPARLVADPDLRERVPDLFEASAPPFPARWASMPSAAEADLVFIWLEEDGGTVAACCPPGRLGTLNAGDAEAYLPLVRVAHAQDMVVAATADIRPAARGLLSATVRVIADRSEPGAPQSSPRS